ncbi:hypothetical protein [Streptomyces sp. BBFR109]|uniref:hypothetical protein n=1 Tax=Streptomyces sp. BBFR109 TaxID=3448172 RepID=UPI003F769241
MDSDRRPPEESGTPRRTRTRWVFDGFIAGLGTASGTRLVLGHWTDSPFGPVSDVMLERPDGHRVLLAPDRRTADFIAGTYSFDEVRVEPVAVRVAAGCWAVSSRSLSLRFVTGRRGPLGLLLSAVPRFLAVRPWWIAVVDRPARVLRGVRTRGSAGGGRREWYGARDLRPVLRATARFDGVDLGPPAPVAPAVRFGFGSTPRGPCVVRVTTTVEGPGTTRAGGGAARRFGGRWSRGRRFGGRRFGGRQSPSRRLKKDR